MRSLRRCVRRNADKLVAQSAQALQQRMVAVYQCLLLRARPTFDLRFALPSRWEVGLNFNEHESVGRIDRGRAASSSLVVFKKAGLEVSRTADIETA